MRVLGLLGLLGAGLLAAACSPDASIGTHDEEVVVDTHTRASRAQYDANVGFANAYVPRCQATGNRPRALVTGFGRFLSVADNATGRIVAELAGIPYPETSPPPEGQVDPPGPRLSVGTKTLVLPGVGEVDVCAMILPVDWDLASVLVAREADAFRPSFVLMNGVAGGRQPLWIELGSTNRAERYVDGTNLLVPAGNEDLVPLVEDAPASEQARPNLLAWDAVQKAARAAVRCHAGEEENGVAFADIVPDVVLAGYPRSSNTYLCNNTTYVTGYLMDHPHQKVRLLRASAPIAGRANEVDVTMANDLSAIPRVFVHWPSDLATMHRAAGVDVMASILGAQLGAARATRGDAHDADATMPGGAFF